jgi:hypothetical protein
MFRIASMAEELRLKRLLVARRERDNVFGIVRSMNQYHGSGRGYLDYQAKARELADYVRILEHGTLSAPITINDTHELR